MYAQWKEGQVTHEEQRDAACHCREKIHVAKAQLELQLTELWGTVKTVISNILVAIGSVK